jgi:hypothetical protein
MRADFSPSKRRGTGIAIPDGMSSINSFRDLLVWRKSVDLAVNCHRIATRFPRDEQPALRLSGGLYLWTSPEA